MKKNNRFFIFILLFSTGMIGQKNHKYKFVEINKKEAFDGGYIQRDFEYTRVYHNNSIVEEVELLPGKKSFFFKIKKNYWYVKNRNRWDLFYSFKKNISPKIFAYDRFFLLKFERHELINKIDCLVYTFQNEKYSTKTGDTTSIHLAISDFPITQYWFNRDLGIIKIKSDDFEFIREDILN